MSKRLICLALSIVMLLSLCLTSCGGKDSDEAMSDINETANVDNRSLVVYLMSEAPVDAETEAIIEDAVNDMTEEKFNTRLDLRFYTEDEYYAQLDKAFADREAAKAAGTLAADKAVDSNETETDEYGIPVPVYPGVASYQVDIFYMGGKENFDKYKSKGVLARLDDEINNSSIISTNIPKQLLENIKGLNSGTYAIPTSKVIGEYTYLLLNKEALEAAYLKNDCICLDGATDYSQFTSLTCGAVEDFLAYVTSDTNTLSDDYYPIYTNLSTEELLISNIQYWGIGDDGKLSDAFSVLGGYYGRDDKYLDSNVYAKMENLFENETFLNDIKVLKSYEINNYYEAEDGKKFAVGYVQGGAELEEIYGEEYELIPVAIPRLTEEEIYSDMFAISAHTAQVSRAMEILEFMNSDEEFRNLLYYGVEDLHYQLISTGVENKYGEEFKVVEQFEESKKYQMDPNKTGNTFLIYPLKDSSLTLSGYQVAQNQIAGARLDLGFALDLNNYKVDTESLAEVKTLSEEIMEAYRACKTMDEFNIFVTESQAKIEASEAVQLHLGCGADGSHNKADGKCHSLRCSYIGWLTAKKIIK